VFLLSTGSEATENCIKLSKTFAMEKYAAEKIPGLGFSRVPWENDGAQLAGACKDKRSWLGEIDRSFVQVPFPDGYKNEDTSFDLFIQSLKKLGVASKDIAG